MGGESSKFSDLKTPHVLRRHSTRSIRYAENPKITIGNSKSCQNVAETAIKMRDSLSVPEIGEIGTQNSGNNSPAQRAGSIRRKNTISVKMRQLIQSCFQNPHEVIGRKIAKRACDFRHDFSGFFVNLPMEQRDEFEESIKMLLKKSVANIDFPDEVTRLSEEFGARLVALRALGFKPEFMTPLADAFIRECTYLDSAVHPKHVTSAAFTEFMSLIFSAVRNGYYAQMRKIRRASHSNSFNAKSSTSSPSTTHKRLSMDSAVGSGASTSPAPRGSSSRSISPGAESIHDECFNFENGYLRPPTSTYLPVSARSA